MPASKSHERVLIMAPVGQDAASMAALLAQHGIASAVCANVPEASRQITPDAGALVLTEEALELPKIANLLGPLKAQPAWSELPTIILTSGGESRLAKLLNLVAEAAGTVTLLERPISTATFLRSVDVALRSRRRQYQVRDLLEEQQRREAQLLESEQLLRLVTSGARVGLLVVNSRYEYLFANEAYGEVLGLQPSEIVGKRVSDLLSAAWPQVQPRLDRALAGERVTYEIVLPSDGRRGEARTIAFTYEPHHDRSGNPAVVIVAIDVTLSKRADEARGRLASIVESSEDAIVSKDLNGIITTWNRGAERLFGYSASEAVGQSITIVIPPDRLNEEPTILEKIRHGQSVKHFETVRLAKDGTLKDISLTVSPIWDEQGNLVGASKIARDITARKAAEAALAQARRELQEHATDLERIVSERTRDLLTTNEQLEEFVYSIAHDLRAPLRTMGGYSQLLLEDYAKNLDPTAQHLLKRIESSSEFMDKLILDLLAYGRTARAEMELGRVNVLHAWQTALFQCNPQIEQSNALVETIEPLPPVLAHDPTLGQCLTNLLMNALKFIAPGVRPHVRFRAEDRGDYSRMWVEDNGIGIPAGQHERVFRVFERLHGSRYAGTGIGLSIVRKGIERMGGRVGVESEPGKGSRFWIELRKAT